MEKQGGKMTKSTTRNRKNNNNTKDEKMAKALKIKDSTAQINKIRTIGEKKKKSCTVLAARCMYK